MVDTPPHIITRDDSVYKGFFAFYCCHPPVHHDRVWYSDPLVGLATDVFNALVYSEQRQMKYDSRLVTAMRNYFKELEKPHIALSINGEFPRAHERKIRSILNNARRMMRPKMNTNDLQSIYKNTWYSCVGFAQDRIADRTDKTSDFGIAWADIRIHELEEQLAKKDKMIATLRVKAEAIDGVMVRGVLRTDVLNP